MFEGICMWWSNGVRTERNPKGNLLPTVEHLVAALLRQHHEQTLALVLPRLTGIRDFCFDQKLFLVTVELEHGSLQHDESSAARSTSPYYELSHASMKYSTACIHYELGQSASNG